MLKHTPSLLLIAASLSACAVRQAPDTAAAATPQAEDVLYPAPDVQTQINRLGIQVSRLEQQVQTLQTRIRQLERRSPARSAAASIRPQQAVSTVSADETAINRRMQQNAANSLQRAQSQYKSGDYKAAVATLRYAENGGDGSDAARMSMYLLMQSHQRLNNCESAINIGNRFVGRFRDSREAPEALFNIGQCQYNMQQRDIAKTTWQKLVQTYPDSPAAKRAYRQLKK